MKNSGLEKIKSYALKLISMYPRTVKEIFSKLKNKNFDDKSIEIIIEELIEENYLNDGEYAVIWLKNQLRNRPCGRMLCVKLMRNKGLDQKIIDKTLAERYSDERETELANDLAEKKRKNLLGEKIKTNKKIESKITFYLKGKGFASDIIYQSLKL